VTESTAALSPAEGTVAPSVAEEFPGLRLQWATVTAHRRDSPRSVVRTLKQLAGRYRGASVVTMRTKPIPQAYRTFFRQIGLDPDVDRVPSEHVAVERLVHGGFRSVDLITDACLIALIETGVPVWALDADAVAPGGLGIRPSTEADTERSRAEGSSLPPGTLVVADAATVHGRLFAPPEPGHGVHARTQRVTVFAIGVDGVPAVHLEEALWICLELLT
jgi:DNA/RNA-binding domain of Phe-tRNA-synthetase-like protein